MRTILLATIAFGSLTSAVLGRPVLLTDREMDQVVAGGTRVGSAPGSRDSTIMMQSSDLGQESKPRGRLRNR